MEFVSKYQQTIIENTIDEIKTTTLECNYPYSCVVFHTDNDNQIVTEAYFGDELFTTEEYANSKSEFFKKRSCDYLIYINNNIFDNKGFLTKVE